MNDLSASIMEIYLQNEFFFQCLNYVNHENEIFQDYRMEGKIKNVLKREKFLQKMYLIFCRNERNIIEKLKKNQIHTIMI